MWFVVCGSSFEREVRGCQLHHSITLLEHRYVLGGLRGESGVVV